MGKGAESSRVGWHPSWGLPLSAWLIKNMWTQSKWWNWFWKTNKTQFEIYPLQWSDLWDCTQHCPCTTGIQQCVCMVCTKIHGGSSQKLMSGGALSFLQSFKRGANRFPESLVTLWDMGSPFYSKWALMQWTHSSSLRATKCKVCHYAVKLWHLYSMLQKSSALYSCFEIQKQMWIYAVTCHADCISLLAGRGNEQLSFGLILEHRNTAP